jgi:hypothetical protein
MKNGEVNDISEFHLSFDFLTRVMQLNNSSIVTPCSDVVGVIPRSSLLVP